MSFAIGIERTKKAVNVGTLLRSAYNFGASMIFTIGMRYEKQASDTTKAFRHIPLLNFKTWGEYKQHAPYSWEHVGVEIEEKSISLPLFVHPKSAVYLLGPEDGSLSAEARVICKSIVSIPSNRCLNLAVAGSIIMYDRIAKGSK